MKLKNRKIHVYSTMIKENKLGYYYMFKKSKTKEPYMQRIFDVQYCENILHNYANIKREAGKYNID